MKRYLSVKEAASLLGVSTNTIYSYLKEGKIRSRRIGMGRIKIPYNELAPYIGEQAEKHNLIEPIVSNVEVRPQVQDLAQNVPVDKIPELNQQKFQTSQQTIVNTTDSSSTEFDVTEISPKQNDIHFYRIFKGIIFLGLGVINILTSNNTFSFIGTFLVEADQLIKILLPTALLFAGFFNIFEVLGGIKYRKYHLSVDLFSSIVLLCYAFVSIVTGEYRIFVFTAAFAGIALGHLLKGNHDLNRDFRYTFLQFSLYLTILGLTVILFNSTLFPVLNLQTLVEANKAVFAVIWIIVFIIPLVYFISPFGEQSNTTSIYLILTGSLIIFFSSQLLLASKWNAAYMCLMTAIFTYFLAWWCRTRTRLDARKIYFLVLVFMWISGSLVFGIFAIKTSREQTKAKALGQAEQELTTVVNNINGNVDANSTLLVSYAGRDELKQVIAKADQEQAISQAKTIFEKSENIRRVIIFSKEGIAIGVYPRDTLVQGTNLSSREYFKKTAESYHGVVSDVFKNVLGEPSVLLTEPVFEENDMVGMIGISFDLQKEFSGYQLIIGSDKKLTAIDANGIIVHAPDKENIGSKVEDSFLSRRIGYEYDQKILINQKSTNTGWTVYMDIPVSVLIKGSTDMDIFLTILLVVNSLISISVGIFVASSKKPLAENILTTGSVPKPQYT